MENIFALSTEQLKNIANALQEKIEEGLKKDGMEIAGIPTYIYPQKDIKDGKVLALDWGGTNFRAAIGEFKNGKASVLEQKKKKLDAAVTAGFTQNDLHKAMAATIAELVSLDGSVTRIGFCFSYPAQCEENGDATLLRWTKGINIPEMAGKPVGKPLMDYLNTHINNQFNEIKILNDTVACMFGGLGEAGYDSYIGLIVGTGTNMASLMRLDKIEKLNSNNAGLIPVNLESGNFNPPYLTDIDDKVDAMSGNKGQQRFEKVISGGYLGEIFKVALPDVKIEGAFDGMHLANMVKDPSGYPAEQVVVAAGIDERSANMVAASLAGLVQVLRAQDASMKKFCLAADGSVFWDKDKTKTQPRYKELVVKALDALLPAGVSITIIDEMQDPNLVGSAIAALS